MTGLITAIIIGVALITFIAKGLLIVQQSEAVVVERLGSYNRTLAPGIRFLIPVIERPRPIKIRRYVSKGLGSSTELEEKLIEETKLDMRESVLNFPQQPVVTSDNVTLHIDGALYYQIEVPRDAVYEVENFTQAIEVLAKTKLRSVIGGTELDSVFSARDQINSELLSVLDEAGNKWGVKVNRVEIQDVTLPGEVEEAMRQQMTAERQRRAQVTEAEGYKTAQIRQAEGDRDAAIARAEGERKAIEQVLAAGEEANQSVDPQTVVGYLIAQEYIKKLPEIARDGERVLVPYEATGLMGSLESIQHLFPSGLQGAARG